MSGSIISTVSGPLMDGDISWVMDLLISQGFFFSFVSCARAAGGGNPMPTHLLALYRNFPRAENQFVAGRILQITAGE